MSREVCIHNNLSEFGCEDCEIEASRCTTHYACDCIQSRIKELEEENKRLSEYLHDGCICLFESDGETPKSECKIHADIRTQLSRIREAWIRHKQESSMLNYEALNRAIEGEPDDA